MGKVSDWATDAMEFMGRVLLDLAVFVVCVVEVVVYLLVLFPFLLVGSVVKLWKRR